MERYLLAFDFDNTIAQTFVPSPNNLGVLEVHDYVVKDIFGEKGLTIYKNKLQGLQNRAPLELVHQLLTQECSETLKDCALEFLRTKADSLNGQVPKDKGIPLDLNLRPLDQVLTELFVRTKLLYLVSEVGQKFPDSRIWPQPTNGFLEFWETVTTINSQSDFRIDTAIISSGHENFIRKTFSVWGIDCPNILVTDDDIRAKKYPQQLNRRVKPGVFPFALAHHEWLRMQALTDCHFDINYASAIRDRIVYFGDDPQKDGMLAENSGVSYGQFGSLAWQHLYNNQFVFDDWCDPAYALKSHQTYLQVGMPIAEAFIY